MSEYKHHLHKVNLRPLHDSIIFQFLDEVGDGQFINQKTASGIIIPRNLDSTAGSPRWGLALAVGPECTDVKVGDFIFIEQLRWTTEVKVDDIRVWRTTEKDVIAITEDNEPPHPEFA